MIFTCKSSSFKFHNICFKLMHTVFNTYIFQLKNAEYIAMEFSPYFSCKNQKTYNYTSDLFQSYGSPCGIDVIPEIIGNPTPLSLRHPRCRNNFSAKQPCCPLQTPNRGKKLNYSLMLLFLTSII